MIRKKPKPPPLLVPKRLGARIKPKNDHWYSEEHLKLVRAQPCLITRSLTNVIAHHPKELFPSQMGSKISDFLCVPLLTTYHDGFAGSLHRTNNVSWWIKHGRNPYFWLKQFLRRHYPTGHPGAEHALSEIERYQQRYG